MSRKPSPRNRDKWFGAPDKPPKQRAEEMIDREIAKLSKIVNPPLIDMGQPVEPVMWDLGANADMTGMMVMQPGGVYYVNAVTTAKNTSASLSMDVINNALKLLGDSNVPTPETLWRSIDFELTAEDQLRSGGVSPSIVTIYLSDGRSFQHRGMYYITGARSGSAADLVFAAIREMENVMGGIPAVPRDMILAYAKQEEISMRSRMGLPAMQEKPIHIVIDYENDYANNEVVVRARAMATDGRERVIDYRFPPQQEIDEDLVMRSVEYSFRQTAQEEGVEFL